MKKENYIPDEILNYKNPMIEEIKEALPTNKEFAEAITNYCINLGDDRDFYRNNFLVMKTSDLYSESVLKSFKEKNIEGLEVERIGKEEIGFKFNEQGIANLNTMEILEQKKYDVFPNVTFSDHFSLISKDEYEKKLKLEELKNYKNPAIEEIIGKLPPYNKDFAVAMKLYCQYFGDKNDFYEQQCLVMETSQFDSDQILDAFEVKKGNPVYSAIYKQKTNIPGLLISQTLDEIHFSFEKELVKKINDEKTLEQKKKKIFSDLNLTSRFDIKYQEICNSHFVESGKIFNVNNLKTNMLSFGDERHTLTSQIMNKVRRNSENKAYIEYLELFKKDPMMALVSFLNKFGCEESFENEIAKTRWGHFISVSQEYLDKRNITFDCQKNIYNAFDYALRRNIITYTLHLKAKENKDVNEIYVLLAKDINTRHTLEKHRLNNLISKYEIPKPIETIIPGVSIFGTCIKSKDNMTTMNINLNKDASMNTAKAVLYEIVQGLDISNVNKILE